MANNYTALVPKILAMALMSLRETCLMPSLVNTSYSMDAMRKGSTIDIQVPLPRTAKNVVPSPTDPANTDTETETVQLVLDNWKYENFHLTDKELGEIDAGTQFLPVQMTEGFRSIANAVNTDILSNYKGIYGFTGTAGTTPFSDTTDATNARKILAGQLAPKVNRRGIMDADAEAQALELSAFQDASKAASAETIREGEIGRKFGIDWYMEDGVPTHTAGDASGRLINQADHAIGDNTVAVDTGTGSILEGDVFTVAGDTQTYVCSADLAGAGSLTYEPAAKTAFADNAAITVKADHVVNQVFNRDAYAFATRPVADMAFEGGSIIRSLRDPKTGLVMSLEMKRQSFQTAWYLSMLWGSKLVRPELATRIAG